MTVSIISKERPTVSLAKSDRRQRERRATDGTVSDAHLRICGAQITAVRGEERYDLPTLHGGLTMGEKTSHKKVQRNSNLSGGGETRTGDRRREENRKNIDVHHKQARRHACVHRGEKCPLRSSNPLQLAEGGSRRRAIVVACTRGFRATLPRLFLA